MAGLIFMTIVPVSESNAVVDKRVTKGKPGVVGSRIRSNNNFRNTKTTEIE